MVNSMRWLKHFSRDDHTIGNAMRAINSANDFDAGSKVQIESTRRSVANGWTMTVGQS